MNRQLLAFLALAITLIYGAGFALIGDDRQGWASVGRAAVRRAAIAAVAPVMEPYRPPVITLVARVA